MNLNKLPVGASIIVYASSLLDSKLKEITEDARKDMIKYFVESAIEKANRDLKLIKEHKITHSTQWRSKFPNEPLSDLIEKGHIPGSPTIDPEKASIKPDHKEIAEKSSVKQTTAILQQFYDKSHQKLDPLIQKAGEPESISIPHTTFHQGAFEADMVFKWNDGRGFQVRTKIVTVVNERGTWFARYPTTFHDVVLKGGVPMKSPSEKKLQTEF